MAILKVKDAQQKTTKSGKPYLVVKSSTDKFYTIWDDNQAIWHLFYEGQELDVITATNGKFTSITGVVGLGTENSVASPTRAGNGTPNAWDWVIEKMKEMDKKLDWLIEERKTLGLPPEKEKESRIPSLDEIPVIELEDKEPEREEKFFG